ncbi:MAG: nucleotidyltransferase domain-containing protein [Coprothermobacterota bacterium]|nr:nucleotidyltransferase domain-containing protein [Coprothermobacterota bacterium]
MDELVGDTLSAHLLERITERITQALQPEMIWLYGSYAYGQPHPDSDIDLLVVVSDLCSPYQEAVKAYRALRGSCAPVEIKVVTRTQFDRRIQWVSSVEHDVKLKGKLLYAT